MLTDEALDDACDEEDPKTCSLGDHDPSEAKSGRANG